MNNQNVIHDTFVIDRSFPHPTDKVFQAFSDPTKKRRWFAEGGEMTVESFAMDFKTGGKEVSRYRWKGGGPVPKGTIFTNDTVFMDIRLNHQIVLAYSMSMGDQRISSSLATIEFRPDRKNCQLVFTEQSAFFEGADGGNVREAGWRALLDRLGDVLSQI